MAKGKTNKKVIDGLVFGVNLTKVNNCLRTISLDAPNRDMRTIFNMNFDGHEFNALPFLLNGSAWLSPEYRGYICQGVSNLDINTYQVHIDELKKEYKDSGVDFDLFDSLLPCEHDYAIRWLGLYLYLKNPKSLVRNLVWGASEAFQRLIFDETIMTLEFKYNSICNTQAFSYMLLIAWLLQLDKSLIMYVRKRLNDKDFSGALKRACPEGSIHYKYISGEIDSKELSYQYWNKKLSDGSCVFTREYMSLATDGNYDGSDMHPNDVGNCDTWYSFFMTNVDYKLNLHLAYCFMFDGGIKRLTSEVESLNIEKEDLIKRVDSYRAKITQQQSDIDELKSDSHRLQNQVSELSNKAFTSDVEKELRSKIAELEVELKSKSQENSTLVDMIVDLKQQSRSQKKQIKQLTASLDKNIESDDYSIDEFAESENITVEEAADFLKDKRILVVGGDRSSSFIPSLEKYGLKHVKQFDNSIKGISKCDCILLITILVSHSMIEHCTLLAKNTNASLVYYNGTNSENAILTMYDELS